MLGEVAGAASMSRDMGLKVILGQIATPSSLCNANALFKHAPPLANRKRKATKYCSLGLGVESCYGLTELNSSELRWEGRQQTRISLQLP